MTWIAPQRPPDVDPDPSAPTWREELALVRECIPEALTPAHEQHLLDRERELLRLLGDDHE
jgi:hypothetical protein